QLCNVCASRHPPAAITSTSDRFFRSVAHFLLNGWKRPPLQMRQTRVPLDTVVQFAEDLPWPVIVLLSAREPPRVTNGCELHLETAQLFCQRFGDRNHS